MFWKCFHLICQGTETFRIQFIPQGSRDVIGTYWLHSHTSLLFSWWGAWLCYYMWDCYCLVLICTVVIVRGSSSICVPHAPFAVISWMYLQTYVETVMHLKACILLKLSARLILYWSGHPWTPFWSHKEAMRMEQEATPYVLMSRACMNQLSTQMCHRPAGLETCQSNTCCHQVLWLSFSVLPWCLYTIGAWILSTCWSGVRHAQSSSELLHSCVTAQSWKSNMANPASS